MTEPADLGLLSTKTFRPPLPVDCVERPELLRLLEEGSSRPLTLVSAPAGYGKSVLVTSWLEQSEWPSVWISLDEEDGNLKRFISYLCAAIRGQFSKALETTLNLSKATELPATEAVANIISNEINAIDEPFFLVLDDYHRIHAESSVNDVLRILLDHPPIPLHLVLLTRRDPPLPIGRLRGIGQVTEIRMQDLQFSATETEVLLEHAAHIDVSDETIANLERELEGWAAGLRLMTMALRNTPDPNEFMQGLSGGTQQMQEYLISEVLSGLPEWRRATLLRCALLDRFSGPLCEAVCFEPIEEEGKSVTGAEFLEDIQNENMFVIPLDGYGRWFRFHQLFQNLLQSELASEMDAGTIASINMRAAKWFEENGLIEDAIRSALKAGNFEVAADIFERHRLDELEQLNWHVIDRWLELLSYNTSGRPGLQLAEAFVAVRRFDVPRQAAILEEAAPIIENNPEYAHLIGELRTLQGILHYRMGDGETSHRLLQDAHPRFEPTQRRGIAGFGATQTTLSLGLLGDGETAIAQNEALTNSAVNGDPLYYSLALAGRVGLRYLLGDLIRAGHEAMRLQHVAEAGGAEFALALGVYFRAGTNLHKGDFDGVEELSEAILQRRYTMPLRIAFSALAALALSRQLLHRDSAATRTVNDFLNLAQEHNNADGIAAARSCQARIQLLQGDIDKAAKWAGLDPTPPSFADLFLSVEVPALTRARVWIAQGSEESLSRAHTLLKQISQRARDWHVTSQEIEADILASLTLAGLERTDEALERLGEAMKRASPGGWLRPFIEAGQPMADLLGQLERQGLATDFSRMALIETHDWLAKRSGLGTSPRGAEVAAHDGIREILTAREMDILGLLANRMQNKEIARELSVSPETVKTHLKNLYSKLGVSSRREAAVRSEAILEAGPDPR